MRSYLTGAHLAQTASSSASSRAQTPHLLPLPRQFPPYHLRQPINIQRRTVHRPKKLVLGQTCYLTKQTQFAKNQNEPNPLFRNDLRRNISPPKLRKTNPIEPNLYSQKSMPGRAGVVLVPEDYSCGFERLKGLPKASLRRNGWSTSVEISSLYLWGLRQALPQ